MLENPVEIWCGMARFLHAILRPGTRLGGGEGGVSMYQKGGFELSGAFIKKQ